MTRKEYLDSLYYEIGNMSAEQKDEIISIFIEHFEQGALDGKSENEICIDLGEPSLVAAQFIENNRNVLQQMNGYVKHPANERHASEHRANEQHKNEHHANERHISRPANEYDININKRFNSTDINKLNINVNFADIKMYSGGDDFTVTIYGRAKNITYDVYVSNGIMNIIEHKKFVLANIFNLNKSINIEINIPTIFNGTLYLKSLAGNVNIDNASINYTELNMSAGEVKINNHTGTLDLRSSAGDIKLNNIRGNVGVSSSAGDISIDGCEGDIKSTCTAGNVKINNNRGYVHASATAGNIKIITQELIGIRATSSAGNIKIETHRLSGDAYLSSSAGNVKFEVYDVRGSILAKTSMGNATVLLPKNTSIKIVSQSIGSTKSQLVSDPASPYTLDISAGFGDVSIKCMD